MQIHRLEHDHLTACYETAEHTGILTLKGKLSPDVLVECYRWLNGLFRLVRPQTVRGIVIDSRKASTLGTATLKTLERHSRSLHTTVDFAHARHVVVVADDAQAADARTYVQYTMYPHNKAVVFSLDDARAFIQQPAATGR